MVSGKSYGVDIGKFGNERYFVYIAAFGAFTEVSYSTPQDIKNLLGHQAYILESIKALGNLKSYKMHVAWDHGEADGEFIFGMVTNTTSVGGFSGLAPKDVSFHDGLFEGLVYPDTEVSGGSSEYSKWSAPVPGAGKQGCDPCEILEIYCDGGGRGPVGP